ncbi:MAG TPA: M20/M25/M40 family metallo-hydrolase [Blastocatellia bacterium]|nr:M20/M25/M40 family metallo-hydrolase [Blastocatellia bacterium]
MKKILALITAVLLLSLVAGINGQEAGATDLSAADEAWKDGKYVVALRTYLRLLQSQAGDRFVEPIATRTGELFQTEEITADGRAPRLSPDGAIIAYETGNAPAVVTRLVQVAGGRAVVAELPGTGAVFSPSGNKIAYLKLPQNEDLKKAQAALDAAPAQGPARAAAQQTLNYLQSKHAVVTLRDLQTKQETELRTETLLKSSLAVGPDGETVYFVGAREGETTRNDIYAVTPASAQPVVVTESDGFKTRPLVDPRGKLLLFLIPGANPFPPSRSADNRNAPVDQPRGEGQGQRSQAGAQAGGQGGGGTQFAPTKFGAVDLASRKVTVVNGLVPTLAADGSAIAYVTRAGQESSLMLLQPGGDSTTLLKANDRIDAPAFSPSGDRLVYQKMTHDDWELYLIGRDGKNETRLTREIQHDVAPRFISKDRVLAMIGEPRHRRSYLYDLAANTRVQIFHNNTVRTISPEYEWMASPDGSKAVVWADRDGDTVSLERGVYLVHLDRKVSKADLIARLERNLSAETALQNEGQRIYAPIADEVRRTVEQASTHRIFAHEKALFDFDSKHISRPGNKLAEDYLFAAYKSFGYEPERQCFEHRQALGGKTCNIIAKLPGTENPELIYVVSSHYDSVVAGPGADDDTSGTAALLEASRMLAGRPQPATIIFASFTGEEGGLLGSREFVRRALGDKLKIVGALNNDMIGWANDNRLDNTIRYTNAGIRDIQHTAASLFTRLITYDARYHRGTDATAFFEAYGNIIGGIGSYPVLGNPHYHQASDLLEAINHQLITEVSKTTVASLMMLASSPSPVKDLKVAGYDGRTAELSWTPSPEKSVRNYIVDYGPENGPKLRVKAGGPRATLRDVKPGAVVSVKAVNARGVEGWDWSRVTITLAANANPGAGR